MDNILEILLTVIGFLVVYTLNGIKGEIKEVKITVKSLEQDLRGGLSGLERRVTDELSDHDRRITRVETRCGGNHGD